MPLIGVRELRERIGRGAIQLRPYSAHTQSAPIRSQNPLTVSAILESFTNTRIPAVVPFEYSCRHSWTARARL